MFCLACHIHNMLYKEDSFTDLHDMDVLCLHVHHPLLPARNFQLPHLQENKTVLTNQDQCNKVQLKKTAEKKSVTR